MALQLLPILQLIVYLCSPATYAYPTIYGTKRYGRSQPRIQSSSWTLPIQYQVRTQRVPLTYYDLYPYSQSYPDDYYYPQDSYTYPIYYAAPRTSKYEVYQAVLPYYYSDRPLTRPNYNYYNYGDVSNDPMVDLEEELLQENEKEDKDNNQVIGRETYYDKEKDTDLDDVNAAFLQNLIMSQMYKDALDNSRDYGKYPSDNYYGSDEAYGKWEEYPSESKHDYFQEDENVRELKQLANPHRQNSHYEDFRESQLANKELNDKRPTLEDRRSWFEKGEIKGKKLSGKKIKNLWENNWTEKRDVLDAVLNNNGDHGKPKPSIYAQTFLAFSDRKPKPTPGLSSTSVLPATTVAPMKSGKPGQKEEVMIRPATPVRHPFSNQVLDIMNKEDDRKRTPSVYDTIKHMLDIEKSMEKVSFNY